MPTSFTGSFLWNTRRGEKSAPSRANHALQRTSQWSQVEVRHPARDGMRRCPVLADWTSHVFVHEHPRNCSLPHEDLQNGRAFTRRQLQSWDKASYIKASKSPNTPQEKNAARLHIFFLIPLPNCYCMATKTKSRAKAGKGPMRQIFV